MRLRDAACSYAARGWAVLPLERRSKQPNGLLVPHGLKEATSDLATVFQWWERRPAANIGISCEASGLVVLDIDPRNGGDDTLADLEKELGSLPDTMRSLTGSGGLHILFRHPDTDSLRGQLGPGLDVKSRGYIVAPPSLHPNGRRYEWEV